MRLQCIPRVLHACGGRDCPINRDISRSAASARGFSGNPWGSAFALRQRPWKLTERFSHSSSVFINFQAIARPHKTSCKFLLIIYFSEPCLKYTYYSSLTWTGYLCIICDWSCNLNFKIRYIASRNHIRHFTYNISHFHVILCTNIGRRYALYKDLRHTNIFYH